MRRMTPSGTGATGGVIPAVLGLFAAIDIPICYGSIRWWRTQHPSAVFGGDPDSGIDKSMYPAFLWNVLAWAMWGACLVALRYALERRRQLAAERSAMALLGEAGISDPAVAPERPLAGKRGLTEQGGLA